MYLFYLKLFKFFCLNRSRNRPHGLEPEPEPAAWVGAGAGQDWTGSTTLGISTDL